MSDDKVTTFKGYTSLPIPVERVAKGLLEDADNLENVLVLGFNKKGELISRSSKSDVGAMLEMMEQFKYNLFSGAYKRVE